MYALSSLANSRFQTFTVRFFTSSRLKAPVCSSNRLIPADINVTGTSSGKEGSVVVDLECSDTCEDITATGTNITSKEGTATFVCKNIASTSEVCFFRPEL